MSAFVKYCATGYSNSITSVELTFLVKLLLKFSYKCKFNKSGQIIFFVAVLHASTELAISNRLK